jgi:transmembrane sensor
MDYLSYRAEDFAADESFQNWVYRRNPPDIRFWERWLQEHPYKHQTVQQAVALLQGLKGTENPVPFSSIEASWQKLDRLIDRQAASQAGKPAIQHYLWTGNWYKVAAAIAGILLVAAIALFGLEQKDRSHTTDFGKISRITLPDGSQVTLNGNSTLRYDTDWETAGQREVWLQGEAFFRVVKQTHIKDGQPANRKFIVHTADLDVEVLGTTFNVLNRKAKTQVVLNTGKVKVEGPLLNEQELVMQPGDLVEVSHQNNTLTRKTVNPQNFSSWINKKLVFDNTPLREVAMLLEETYGVQVEVADNLLLDQKVSGSVPNDNIHVLLHALARSFDLNIRRSGEKITLYSEG